MAQFNAYTAFNIDNFDLNWFLIAYGSEAMVPSVLPGWEDNYVIYTFLDEALVMAGSGFGYDAYGLPTIGTIEALGEAYMDYFGFWLDEYWMTGLDLSMSAMLDAIITSSNVDDLALLEQQFSGNDEIYLSFFNDRMTGYGGNDKIYGFDGDDTLLGASGRDKLYGGADNDTLSGGSGRDSLKGGAGDDMLKGGSEDDTIRGGSGRDREFGGKGEDTFVFVTGDDKSFIQDFDATGRSHDVIDLSGLVSVRGWKDLVGNHLERDGVDVRIDGGDGDVIVLRDVSLDSLNKGDFLF